MTEPDLASRLMLARRHGNIAMLGRRDGVIDVKEAYEVQTAISSLDEIGVAGWKVTALNPADQKKFRSNCPVAGAILGAYVFQAPATLSLSSFVSPLLECELAFTLKTDLPARDEPYKHNEIQAAIEDIAVVFEIADSRVPADSTDLLKLSDCMSNGALIIGSRTSARKRPAASAVEIVLHYNGKVVEHGSSARILGDPLRALVALANAQPLPAGGLRRGQVITTGTCTTPVELTQGEFVATFSSIGSVKLIIA